MQNYTWLLMVVAENGRYEKTLELPFVPQVGMNLFRDGAQTMWDGMATDLLATAPPITGFGYNLDEERFEVKIVIGREIELTSSFWDRFVPA